MMATMEARKLSLYFSRGSYVPDCRNHAREWRYNAIEYLF